MMALIYTANDLFESLSAATGSTEHSLNLLRPDAELTKKQPFRKLIM